MDCSKGQRVFLCGPVCRPSEFHTRLIIQDLFWNELE